MRTRPVWFGIAALLISLAGCTSWSRLPESRPVPARGTIQVWSAGEPVLLREARTVDDSLVGRAALPDTTRQSVALASIDSVRAQDFDMGKALIVGTGVGIALLLAAASSFGMD
jgi:hypothetical protein